MKQKLIFPILAAILAILACSIPSTTTPIVPPASTETNTLLPQMTETTSPSAVPSTPAASGLTMDMLRNGTYHTIVYGRTITLVNGSYSETTTAGTYNAVLLDTHAFGDLNGDGVEDAAVILVENNGGTGQFETLLAIYNSNGIPVQAGENFLGDRVVVSSADISSGVIHLDMLVDGPNDPLCCPSQAQKHSYWMIAGRLWLMRVITTLGGADHMVNVNTPANWADVTNPFTVTGDVPISPFENNLAYHIYLANGTKVNDSSLMVNSAGMGTPGTFSQNFNLSMAGVTGWVIIQFEEVSMADGSTLALGSVVLNVH